MQQKNLHNVIFLCDNYLETFRPSVFIIQFFWRLPSASRPAASSAVPLFAPASALTLFVRSLAWAAFGAAPHANRLFTLKTFCRENTLCPNAFSLQFKLPCPFELFSLCQRPFLEPFSW